MAENERFNKDFAEYDKKVREEQRLKKDMIVEKHRMEQLEREHQKWDRIDHQEQINQNKQEYHRQVLQAGKRNKNGVPYNPITLQYENSNDGQMLRQKDDEAKVRGLIRSGNLDSRNNCGYNVITGEVRKGVEVPSNLYNQFEQKVKQYEQHYSMQPPHK